MSLSAHHSASRDSAAATYRAALRRHPAGVTIITLDAGNGPVGFTATSFASLSLDPPLVSFNIAHTSSSIEALRASKSMVVHLLGDHQLALAQRFSAGADQRFADESTWVPLPTGEPLLLGTRCWIRACISRLIEAGDHTLVLADVAEIHIEPGGGDSTPLLYHEGRYHRAVPVGQ